MQPGSLTVMETPPASRTGNRILIDLHEVLTDGTDFDDVVDMIVARMEEAREAWRREREHEPEGSEEE